MPRRALRESNRENIMSTENVNGQKKNNNQIKKEIKEEVKEEILSDSNEEHESFGNEKRREEIVNQESGDFSTKFAKTKIPAEKGINPEVSEQPSSSGLQKKVQSDSDSSSEKPRTKPKRKRRKFVARPEPVAEKSESSECSDLDDKGTTGCLGSKISTLYGKKIPIDYKSKPSQDSSLESSQEQKEKRVFIDPKDLISSSDDDHDEKIQEVENLAENAENLDENRAAEDENPVGKSRRVSVPSMFRKKRRHDLIK